MAAGEEVEGKFEAVDVLRAALFFWVGVIVVRVFLEREADVGAFRSGVYTLAAAARSIHSSSSSVGDKEGGASVIVLRRGANFSVRLNAKFGGPTRPDIETGVSLVVS